MDFRLVRGTQLVLFEDQPTGPGMMEDPLPGLEAADVVVLLTGTELGAGLDQPGDEIEIARVAQAWPGLGPELG